MSYILNALKKSEKQRQANQAESLESSILEQPEDEQKKISIWLIILVLVNVIFLSYFIWPLINGDKPETKAQIKTESKATPKPVLAKTEKPKQRSIKKSVETQQRNSISEYIAKQSVKNNQSINLQAPKKPKAQKIKTVKKDKLIAKSTQQKTENITLPKIEPVAIVKKPIIEKKALVKAKNNESNPPFLSELSSDFRRSVPNIDINVFVYSENEKERFIMIDMQKYLEGQQMKGGVMLKKIRRNSILVEYKSRVFRIRRK